MQLPVFLFSFFFSFFCQPCSRLRNYKSVFLILKISQYGVPRLWVQLFPKCWCKNWYKNWYLHFHKTYNHQVRQAGTSLGVGSNETNPAGAGDAITSKPRAKLKKYRISITRVSITIKLFRMVTYLDKLLPMNLHLNALSEITWQTKIIIPPLPQCLCLPYLVDCD